MCVGSHASCSLVFVFPTVCPRVSLQPVLAQGTAARMRAARGEACTRTRILDSLALLGPLCLHLPPPPCPTFSSRKANQPQTGTCPPPLLAVTQQSLRSEGQNRGGEAGFGSSHHFTVEGIKGPRRMVRGGGSKMGRQGKDVEEPRRHACVGCYPWGCHGCDSSPQCVVCLLPSPLAFLPDRS